VAQFCSVRRALTCLLAVLATATVLSVVTGSGADAGVDVDRRLGQGTCALTGRAWVPGRGCARRQCVAGAKIFKAGHNAELCEMRGRYGALFAQPIDSRRCKELGRIWIDQINGCASNPNRARPVVRDAPQCRRPGSTYVNHRELEGRYDECLRPGRAARLKKAAKRAGETLNKAALNANPHNCSYRAGWVMVDGRCVKRQGPVPEADLGGFYMVGDSVSWRGEDELAPRVPSWELDLRPGRRLDELPGRLAWFRANHGNPDQVIVQLGTNRRRGYGESDFRATMATLPPSTPVLFLLPYRKNNGENVKAVRATKKAATWMRNLAAERPLTCLADWPAYASHHLSNLVDGEHPDSQHEGWYGRFVTRSWNRCAAQLGR
jgi:hypothetical protein